MTLINKIINQSNTTNLKLRPKIIDRIVCLMRIRNKDLINI